MKSVEQIMARIERRMATAERKYRKSAEDGDISECLEWKGYQYGLAKLKSWINHEPKPPRSQRATTFVK